MGLAFQAKGIPGMCLEFREHVREEAGFEVGELGLGRSQRHHGPA